MDWMPEVRRAWESKGALCSKKNGHGLALETGQAGVRQPTAQ